MSLALAIDQIQRPTWWHENDRTQNKKSASPETIAMRARIADYLAHQPGLVPAVTVQKEFGLSNAQLWYYLSAMVDDGRIRKVKPRHDQCLVGTGGKQ